MVVVFTTPTDLRGHGFPWFPSKLLDSQALEPFGSLDIGADKCALCKPGRLDGRLEAFGWVEEESSSALARPIQPNPVSPRVGPGKVDHIPPPSPFEISAVIVSVIPRSGMRQVGRC